MARLTWKPIAQTRLEVPVVKTYIAERMMRNQFGAPTPSYDPLAYGAYEPKRAER
jgi:hypothetical protein